MNFTHGARVPEEEGLLLEFKAVTAPNPAQAIAQVADEYAVGFLNADGGRILWGIDDHGEVAGVSLNAQQRDLVQRKLLDSLFGIQPVVDTSRFGIAFHPVQNGPVGKELYVVELRVPNLGTPEPFYTGSGKMFVRLQGVTKNFSGPQITDWIKRRLGARPRSETPRIVDAKTAALVKRVRRVFAAHALEPSHIPRYLELRRAPFSISLSDLADDTALLSWLSEPKLAWISEEFLIRREWLDGEDNDIHQVQLYDKNPQKFCETVTRHLDSVGGTHAAVAFFIRWGVGRDWKSRNNYRVFVVLGIPLVQLSNERTIYRYISDLEPYPWDGGRCRIQLRAWARLLHFELGVSWIMGRETSHQNGERLWGNSVFLNEFLWDNEVTLRTHDDWHPEDYALSEQESRVSKDHETLPDVLDFLRWHGLPTSEARPYRENGQRFDPER